MLTMFVTYHYFLGLRNLTILDDAVNMVRKNQPDFSLDQIPDNDPETYKMLCDGRTSGVFQMESAGMTGVCVGLKPKSIEDITAIIALYRPGPMDSIPRFIACAQNPKLIAYKHPMLEPILSVTYGCIVYQEQVIEIFRRLAGYSLGQADMVRRAMSKKKVKDIEREREAFINGDPSRGITGCVAHGISTQVAQSIYDEIYDFASYAFNKAHAVSYAVVAYQTAWFKCHYPREYMAALLTSVLDSQDKVAEYIGECKENGIALLPPDVNESGTTFTVSGPNIRFGLAAVKGVGRGVVDALLSERERSGAFTDFMDFCQRMYDRDLNRRVVESLIRCGAFDSMGYRRSQLLAVYGQVLDGIAAARKRNLEGQMDLFGFGAEEQNAAAPALILPDLPEFSPQERMTMEKETTGLYLSGHPMDAYREGARRRGAVSVGAILNDFGQEGGPTRFSDEQKVTVAGIISRYKTKTTRNNTLMAYVTLEDDTGAMELLVFARTLSESGNYIRENSPVIVTGRISVRDEKEPQILCDTLRPLGDLDEAETAAPAQAKRLYIKLSGDQDPRKRKVELILSMFPGEGSVILYLEDTKKRLGTQCDIKPALIKELTELLGSENVVVK